MTVEGPDRGYSWVIMFCCAYIHFALFGLFRSWGVIYVAVLQEYGVTRQEASWPFSLCASVFLIIGPVVSIITHYVSNRTTCLLGSTIATIGVVGCYFAPSVMWLTIFYGVIHGFGFGVISLLIPVFLNQYFEKHRATAIGIAFSGGSIGSFLVPIAMERLIDAYDLRGSFLLLGGLVMNTLVASALLRPAPWLRKAKKRAKSLEDSIAKDSGVSTSGDTPEQVKCRTINVVSFPIESELDDSVFIENTSSQDNGNEFSSIVSVSLLDSTNVEEGECEKDDTLMSNNDSILFEEPVNKVSAAIDSNTICKYGKTNTKTDTDIQEPLMNGNHLMSTKPKNKNSRFKSIAFAIIEILKNPMFHLISSSMFIYFLALQCFFVAILDYAKDKGIMEKDAVYLISIFSITDLVARSGLGWITDRKYVKRKNMVIFTLAVIGLLMQLYPLIDDMTGLLVVVAFHGIVAGSCISLFFVLQAEYLGMKRLTLVIGLTSFINGILSLMRPAMIGFFRDNIGSYDWMFHSLGMMSIAFALIWFAESWMTRNTKEDEQNSCEIA